MTSIQTLTADQFESSEEIITALKKQRVLRPSENKKYHCRGGNKGFRTYLSPLPSVTGTDVEPGALFYRPMHDPLMAYEIISEPYETHISKQVDVRVHSRSHAGDDARIHSHESTIFVSMIVDTMTYMRPETEQTTLPGKVSQTQNTPRVS